MAILLPDFSCQCTNWPNCRLAGCSTEPPAQFSVLTWIIYALQCLCSELYRMYCFSGCENPLYVFTIVYTSDFYYWFHLFHLSTTLCSALAGIMWFNMFYMIHNAKTCFLIQVISWELRKWVRCVSSSQRLLLAAASPLYMVAEDSAMFCFGLDLVFDIASCWSPLQAMCSDVLGCQVWKQVGCIHNPALDGI